MIFNVIFLLKSGQGMVVGKAPGGGNLVVGGGDGGAVPVSSFRTPSPPRSNADFEIYCRWRLYRTPKPALRIRIFLGWESSMSGR